MATNRAMLKEAIADAKAVKDTAIANAKAALEEAFTPQLKSMFTMKLQEMEDEDLKEDGFGKEKAEGDVGFSTMGEKALDETEDNDADDMMEIDLEELLAELNEEEDEMEESLYEAEEGEDEESEESEEEEEGEPLDLEDMTDEDLKDMIEDVIADMIASGELEAGHEGMENEEGAEDETEEMSDEEEVDLAELLREIEEMEEEEEIDEIFGFGKKSAEKGAGGSSFVKDWIGKHQSEIDNVKDIEDLAARKKAASPMILQFNKDAIRAQQDSGSKTFDIGVLWNAFGIDDPRGGKTSSTVFEEELAEAYSTIETLRAELNEINLLNAKLLYTNKIFKAKNLNESQKVKVLSSFDKAKNVGEVKMVFETLNEGIKVVKNTIKENLGSASKTTGTPTVKKPIVESNEAFLRMQKLAGLI